MFKRANKITALLVAAASVMSVVPAMATDYKKVDSQDGVVYGAVAYKDGTAVVDGEVDGNDAVYYLEKGKYTELDNVDSGSDLAAYGEKYVKVDDGSDYDVDLSNGTVIEDDQPSNDEDDAASALRKEIKDSDRYNDTDVSGVGYGDASIADLDQLPGNKFSENWYSAKYAPQSGKLGDNGAPALGYYNVYTDMKGNYIDADYNIGKIKVSTTYSAVSLLNSSVTIENTNDIYDIKTPGDTHAKVTKANVLGQDADNIYRYAEITVTSTADANGNIVINNKAFVATPVSGQTTSTAVLKVIQKISKAQDSGDVDDAKYAKTVYNYAISDDSAVTTGTDATDYLALASNTSTSAPTKATIINGKLALSIVDDSITDADNVTVQTATLKQKNGYYYTDLESQTTIQGEYSTDLNKVAADTDVDGNIYVLDGGYVKVFDGTDDWNKVYKVDGSFDALSTYDKDNMVTWSQGDEVYSVIGGKTDTEEPTTPVVTAGWAQATNGTWTYNKADGTKATGWLLVNGTWYYLKADGVMATGWVQDGATWYYLAGSGAMATGWLNDNGTWYYLNANGSMAANTTVGGYVLGASGAWVK